MNLLTWEKTRVSLLGILLLSILVMLGYKILVSEEPQKNNSKTLIFPNTVSLTDWKLINSHPLELVKTSRLRPVLAVGHKYEYRDDSQRLEVEIRAEKYRGHLNQFLGIYRDMPSATLIPKISYKKGIGYYAFFEYENGTYLGSCINGQGETTVTQNQYNQNRYLRGWGVMRSILWLLGQQDLFDPRCLWTLMLIPNSIETKELDLSIRLNDNEQTLTEPEKKLEKAWLEWYSWWKKNLPSY